MAKPTELALRAVVRGLYHSEAISSDQVRAVCDALKDAAGAAQDNYEPRDAKELLALCRGIKAVTALR